MLDRMLEISTWVQEKREGLGLTQKAFAELLGMPETGERTVSQYLNNISVISSFIDKVVFVGYKDHDNHRSRLEKG